MGFLKKANKQKKKTFTEQRSVKKFIGKLGQVDSKTDFILNREYKELGDIKSHVMTAYEMVVLHEKYRMSKKTLTEFSVQTMDVGWYLTKSYKDDGRYKVGAWVDDEGKEHLYYESGQVVNHKSIAISDLKIMLYQDAGFAFVPRLERADRIEVNDADRDWLHLLAKKRRNVAMQDTDNFMLITMFVLMEKFGWKKQKLLNLQKALQEVDDRTEYDGYVAMVEKLRKNLSLDCGTVSEEQFNKVRYGYEVVDEKRRGLCG